jgi:signal transduction histidine kinase
VPVSFTTCLLEDSQGRLLGALEVLRDLSEVKKMQREVQRSKTLAALGEMAAAVAHEIRNPLGAIGVGISLLEREVADEPEKNDIVKKIIGSLGSLNRIVSNLLLYTKPLSLQLREVNLQEHAAQVLDFIAIGVTREDVQILREFPEAPLVVRIDPEKTEQVLINLVQNALQAIEGTGKITVRISLRERAPGGRERFFLNGLRVDRIAEITVSDTGKGIREENLDEIFNPFFTTRTDGNGLGLSIVRKIVELHNGEITVQSSPGRGAVFTMSLPA